LIAVLRVAGSHRPHHRSTLWLANCLGNRFHDAITLLAKLRFRDWLADHVSFFALARFHDVSHDVVAAIAHYGFIDGPLHAEALFAHRRFVHGPQHLVSVLALFRFPNGNLSRNFVRLANGFALGAITSDLPLFAYRFADDAVAGFATLCEQASLSGAKQKQQTKPGAPANSISHDPLSLEDE
jgi:hypothetical protein